MKNILTIFLLILISRNVYCQTHSDLYLRVDSIIRNELKFRPDTNFNKTLTANTKSQPLGIRDQATVLPDSPLIIIDNNKIVKIEELNQYKLKEVKKIQVFKSNDPYFTALYGSCAVLGGMIITFNEVK